MPFKCSSERRASSHTVGICRSTFLPPSRRCAYTRPESTRAKWLERAPTFSEIDMSLSLRITSRSAGSEPAWFSASNAMPAVMAPSPMTATTRRSSPVRAAATAMPSAAEIEVLEWPTPKVSYSLSWRAGKGAGPLVGGLLERLDRGAGLAAALQEDLDLLLRGLEGCLAVARERDAALEDLQRLIEGQIAALETLHQGLELRQRLFEVGAFAVA